MRANQLFIIAAETWNALDPDEVNATVRAMREFGIFNLPYPQVDIWLPANEKFGWDLDHLIKGGFSHQELMQDLDHGLYKILPNNKYTACEGSGFVFEFRNISLLHTNYGISMHVEPGSPASRWYSTARSLSPIPNDPGVADDCRDQLAKALIVLLGTRNAVKTLHRNKSAGLGIGKSKGRHEYTTTITLPQASDMEGDDSYEPTTTGKPKAPHLRRGHARNQHYGPHNSFVKAIWIEPQFINADRDWVNKRHHYNMSL